MAHPNEEILRKGYEAFNSGDMDAVRETFADDIQWHVAGTTELAGDYKGLDEVFQFFGKFIGMFDTPPQLELHDVLANDEHAVALTKSKASKGGKTRESTAVHVFHVKDGKATEFWGHPFDAHGDDDFINS